MITPNAKNLAGAQWYTHVRLSPRSSITPALPFLLFPFLPRTPSARTRTPTSKWTPTSSASSASARSARARTPISPFPSTHLPSLLTTHLRRPQREHEWVQLCCAARAQGDGVHDGKASPPRAAHVLDFLLMHAHVLLPRAAHGHIHVKGAAEQKHTDHHSSGRAQSRPLPSGARPTPRCFAPKATNSSNVSSPFAAVRCSTARLVCAPVSVAGSGQPGGAWCVYGYH
ncbi:hypothetical protein K438DRAFT_2033778 [Mycena galopus ATCC 62051]|nr:hypothetical protein K438DRAFT_2033778 [Mycena galopus ATCC 62051]